MLRLYQDLLVGPVPRFPQEIESRIDLYLTMNQPPAVLGLDAPEEPRLEGLVGWMGSKPDLEQPAAEVGAGN
jgi:hypothetical protein